MGPHSSISVPHVLVSYSHGHSSWGQVYHIDLAKNTISKTFDLPKSLKGTYSLAEVDANIFFAKVAIERDRDEADFEVWSSSSHARLLQWRVPFPSHTYGLAQVVRVF